MGRMGVGKRGRKKGGGRDDGKSMGLESGNFYVQGAQAHVGEKKIIFWGGEERERKGKMGSGAGGEKRREARSRGTGWPKSAGEELEG